VQVKPHFCRGPADGIRARRYTLGGNFMDPQNKNNRAARFEGPSAACPAQAEHESPWRMILLGAPRVGKGTQALGRLSPLHRRSLPRCLKPAAMRAKPGLAAGDRVHGPRRVGSRFDCVGNGPRAQPMSLLPGSGFILDGFPRTVVQADC
jgi:hypothetical protein